MISSFVRPLAHVAAALAVAAFLFGCVEQEVSTGEPPVQEDTVATVDPIASGEETYETFCASCHGPEGMGNGPVASVLTVPPTDLTRLRDEHGGTFPADSVYAYIDGRQYVQAHGTREMPVWGNIWSEVGGEPVRGEEVDLRIRELVEYIRTIQVDTLGAS